MNTWFHVDMDAFYAAIEELDHPEYRGKPVIIGGPKGSRGVVATANYEARKFGVHAAMPSNEAHTLCPHGIYVLPRMTRYIQISNDIMKILHHFAPYCLQVSVDEAYLDFSNTERLLGSPKEIAMQLKEKIFSEIGLTISVGIASNKFIAKLCSGFQKPNGLTIVEHGKEEAFMENFPLKKVWGIGQKSLNRLESMGIFSIKHIKLCKPSDLDSWFGENFSSFLQKIAYGKDPGLYDEPSESHSISRETTFDIDQNNHDFIEGILLELVQSCVFSLLESGMHSRGIRIKLRNSQFETHTAQKNFPDNFKSIEQSFNAAKELLRQKWDGSPLRLMGFGFIQVSGTKQTQLGLFDEQIELDQTKALETVFALKKKFGNKAPIKARTLLNKNDHSNLGKP